LHSVTCPLIIISFGITGTADSGVLNAIIKNGTENNNFKIYKSLQKRD